MLGRLVATTIVVAALGAAACSDGGTPATAPPTSPPTSAPTATSLLPPTSTTTTSTSSTTTTAPATTTTIDRIAEIEAIITDLELRRLDALYREDEEAFRELFASPGYLEQSLVLLGFLEFIEEPETVIVTVQELLADRDICVAVAVQIDAGQALGDSGFADINMVIERTLDGWGYSYEGTGWECDGDHPLDG